MRLEDLVMLFYCHSLQVLIYLKTTKTEVINLKSSESYKMQFIEKYIKETELFWAVVLFAIFLYWLFIVQLLHLHINIRRNTEFFLFKHSIILGVGFMLMYFAHKVNYRYY